MRIVFTPFSWPTHVYPMVTLAWACNAAGHEVRVAVHPAALDTVTRAGLTGVAVGGGYDAVAGIAEINREVAAEGAPEPSSPEEVQHLPEPVLRRLLAVRYGPHVRAAVDIVDDLIGLLRAWPADLVVTDPVVLAAPLAAAAAGVPLIRHLFGPNASRLLGFPGLGLPIDHWPTGLLNLYDRYGAIPMLDPAVCTVDPCPDSLQLPGELRRVPVRFVPYNGPGAQPAWLSEPQQRSRIALSWSMTNSTILDREEFGLQNVLGVLGELDAETVVLVRSGSGAALGKLPGGVRVAEELPLRQVLPTCQAVVHHGGPGTMLTAAYYGIPQVAVPPTIEQMLHARQLAATGAGVAIDARTADREAVKTAVAAVLNEPAPRAAAERLRAEIHRLPTPAALAGDLASLMTQE